MNILKGHTTPETAYVVADYPYGYRLRCSIRYWIEFHPKRGFRMCSQTTNPKRGNVWNKPKASTYARFGGCMFLDDAGHVQFATLTEYSNATEARLYLNIYGDGVPGVELLRRWVAAKESYEAARKAGDPLHVGTKEAAEAFVSPITGRTEVTEGTMIEAHKAGMAYWHRNKPHDAPKEQLESLARSCGWYGDDCDSWLAGFYGAKRRDSASGHVPGGHALPWIGDKEDDAKA